MSRVVHFEIHCEDLNRAEAFYTDVFDWHVHPSETTHEYRRLETSAYDDSGIDGVLIERRGYLESHVANAWICTIEVDDIVRMERKIVNFGGEQVSERQVVSGIGWQTYFRDTEGNAFSIMQADPEAREPQI